MFKEHTLKNCCMWYENGKFNIWKLSSNNISFFIFDGFFDGFDEENDEFNKAF